MSIRLAHLSDVHVQLDTSGMPLRRLGFRRLCAQFELRLLGRAARYSGAEERLHALALEAAKSADHVILTGDLTALAFTEEFEGAAEALAPLLASPGRFSLIPGNHDRYTARAASERRFERIFGHLLKSDLPKYTGPQGYPFVRFAGEELAIVGLDSTRLAPCPGVAVGRVGERQLAALRALLDDPALSRRALAIMVHHGPLHEDGRPDRRTHGLLDGAELMALLAGRPCTLHHGHIHHRYWHPATPGRPNIFCAGSSTMAGDTGGWLVDMEREDEGARARIRVEARRFGEGLADVERAAGAEQPAQ